MTVGAGGADAARTAACENSQACAVRLKKLLYGCARGPSADPNWQRKRVDLRKVRLTDLMGRPIEADSRKYVDEPGGAPLDPGIAPLVRTLQAVSMGFRTAGSGEGNLYEGMRHYPWVKIRIDQPLGRDALEEIVDGFNATSKVRWMLGASLAFNGEVAVLRPLTDSSIFSISLDEFRRLQASAMDFAGFVYDRYIADRAVRRELTELCGKLALTGAARQV